MTKEKLPSYYAISVGIESNKIVNSWDECKSLVMGYKGAKFKKFNSKQDAEKYLVESQNISEEVDIGLKRDCRKPNTDTSVIRIYTDGSLVRRNNEVYAGYGIYIPEKHFEISRILNGKKTNNRAELTALINAISMFKVEDNIMLDIFTDSQYSIGIFNDTGLKYRAKNYKKNTKEEVPNADLVREAVKLADIYMLKFTHVNSHTSLEDRDSKGNDRADKLAVRGAVDDYISRSQNLGDFVLTFGKYKNHFLKNIPTSYLSWILTSQTFEELCIKYEDRRLEKEIVLKFMENLSQ